jgi:TonB family protein
MQYIMKNIRVQTSLTVLISIFLHLVVIVAMFLPDLKGLLNMNVGDFLQGDDALGRDIIVNINQNDRQEITRKTLLSDRDSTAQGYITAKKGDRWLNNSLDFKIIQGQGTGVKAKARPSAREQDSKKMLLGDESDMTVKETIRVNPDPSGASGNDIQVKIPDKNDVTRENAIFYSNRGLFSFNTAKFKDFQYFKDMKDKIAGNWYPPLMANAIMGGSNPITGTYAPGRLRIMAIMNQEVKIAFTMNRNGDILEVVVVDSYGCKPLDSSCLDAIRLSKSFGKVPDDIQGEIIVIPFIFGYYAY